jgi:hypothetical protein
VQVFDHFKDRTYDYLIANTCFHKLRTPVYMYTLQLYSRVEFINCHVHLCFSNFVFLFFMSFLGKSQDECSVFFFLQFSDVGVASLRDLVIKDLALIN